MGRERDDQPVKPAQSVSLLLLHTRTKQTSFGYSLSIIIDDNSAIGVSKNGNIVSLSHCVNEQRRTAEQGLRRCCSAEWIRRTSSQNPFVVLIQISSISI